MFAGCDMGCSIIKRLISSGSFEFKILCEGEKNYILNLEAEAIKVFQTISPRGYNIRLGGENYSSGYSIEYRSDDSHCYVCGFWFPNRRTALRSLRLNDKTFHKYNKLIHAFIKPKSRTT